MSRLISVIIPTLNEEKTLPLLLSDLTKQTKKNFEVIVVDACSEDATTRVAKSFAKDLKIKVITSKRRNLAYQRNLGAEFARGDFLVFIDADSRVKRGFISSILKETGRKKGLVICPKMDTRVKDLTDRALFSLGNYAVYTSTLLRLPFTPGACLIFERNFFFFIGGFEVSKKQDRKELFPEDVAIMRKVLKANVSHYYSDKIVFRFCMRRFKTEGYLRILKNYFLLSITALTKGKLGLPIKYRMGGDYYLQLNEKKRFEMITRLKESFDKVKKQLSGLNHIKYKH